MKTLTFTQITDDRFEDNIQDRLLQRVHLLKTALSVLPGVTVKTSGLYDVNFGDSKQARCDFYVEKEGRKTTWDDVYKIVNAVKAVPYNMVNMSQEIPDIKLPEIKEPITDEKAAHLFFYDPNISYQQKGNTEFVDCRKVLYSNYQMDNSLNGNKEFILDALKKTPCFTYSFCHISDELKKDKEFMLEAININGNMRMVASPELHEDKDVALAAVSKFGIVLQEFPKFKDDKDIVMTAVQKNGMALMWASERLQDDMEVVHTAVSQNEKSIQYASVNAASKIYTNQVLQNELDGCVLAWYQKEYPTDDFAKEYMNPDITFRDVLDGLNKGKDIYDVIGVGDSGIREEIFTKLSSILDVGYNQIYNKWLHYEKYPPLQSNKEPKASKLDNIIGNATQKAANQKTENTSHKDRNR